MRLGCIPELRGDHVGRREAALLDAFFAWRGDGPAIPPEQVLEDHLVVFGELVQRGNRRQVAERDLVETDIDDALAVRATDPGEPFEGDDRARGGVEKRALARTVPPISATRGRRSPRNSGPRSGIVLTVVGAGAGRVIGA